MILITGASKGIGLFLFQQYQKSNQKVYGTYNSYKPLKNSDLMTKVDIRNEKEINNWINKFSKEIGNITLINCAGINYSSFAHKADLKLWSDVIKTNVIGTFNVINALLPIMRDAGYGRIINFSSVVAQRPTMGSSAYAASKSALWGLVKSISIENASKGITINNINLGYSDIGMGINEIPNEMQIELVNAIPMNRFCDPIEIFYTVEYFRNSSYITGASIDLNGGLI